MERKRLLRRADTTDDLIFNLVPLSVDIRAGVSPEIAREVGRVRIGQRGPDGVTEAREGANRTGEGAEKAGVPEGGGGKGPQGEKAGYCLGDNRFGSCAE